MSREIFRVPQEDKWNFRELLLLADPEEQAIRKYLDESDMYVLSVDGKIVCEAAVRLAEGECELMNLATCEDEQGKGYASELVRFLMRRYAASACEMLVGTSEDGMAFYSRLGFEPAFIRRNFFVENYDEPIIENGRQCVDMHCLRVNLRKA